MGDSSMKLSAEASASLANDIESILAGQVAAINIDMSPVIEDSPNTNCTSVYIYDKENTPPRSVGKLRNVDEIIGTSGSEQVRYPNLNPSAMKPTRRIRKWKLKRRDAVLFDKDANNTTADVTTTPIASPPPVSRWVSSINNNKHETPPTKNTHLSMSPPPPPLLLNTEMNVTAGVFSIAPVLSLGISRGFALMGIGRGGGNLGGSDVWESSAGEGVVHPSLQPRTAPFTTPPQKRLRLEKE
jgi:hypothetical protein